MKQKCKKHLQITMNRIWAKWNSVEFQRNDWIELKEEEEGKEEPNEIICWTNVKTRSVHFSKSP